ncbi:MAG TPA: hypothetical protein VG106_10750, partial [Vicinamibacterales bacterium]|nr:hypothetical protein [Vicinamibacterales bacterium]
MAAILLIAALGTFSIYRHTLDYGFDYDDYAFTRPFAPQEVRSALAGPWDPTGIQVPFYRPLTIAFYAARFERLGLNSHAHHALSLAMFACGAALCGLFVWGITRGALAGALATLFFVVHPAMPYSQAVWATNQMHLLQSIVVLSAFVWWTFVRARTFAWWIPLLVAAVTAFLIKEDGVMLLPVIVTLHWLRRRVAEPALPRVPRAFLAAAAGLIVALVAVRFQALEGVGGYRTPTLERAVWNYVSGLNGVFRLVPPDRPWQLFASWFVTVLPLVALAGWRRAPHNSRFLLVAGAAVSLLFNLPFVMVTKGEQLHLVALGAALVLAGSVLGLASVFRTLAVAASLGVAVTIGSGAMAAVAHHISADFEPYGPVVLAHDRIVEGWAAVPHEIREYLAQKRTAEPHPPANPTDALDVVIFGVHGPEIDPAGLRVRWMSGRRSEILVTSDAREAVVPLRHEAGVFREAALVEIVANGQRVDALELRDGVWRMSRIPLRAADAPLFWRMHRIVLTLQRAWVPAHIIHGSKDTRTLGLQIGDVG